ncbi:MAG TPA: glycosyltransferase [Pyrinomonadaceae bacterium]|nr:glycosyltransferase [Pyrinomonadaceae bacterium]
MNANHPTDVSAEETSAASTTRGGETAPRVERVPVSVVVPVRDEEASVASLVEALKGQTYRPAEVVIVNGGSVDRTAEVVRALTAGDERFRLLEAAAGTPGRNRNLGAEAAAHEWLAFTDAGTRPVAEWLEELVRAAEADAGAQVVYGNYEPVVGSYFERCAALAYPPPKVLRPGGKMTRGPSTASMMMRREVWQTLGGFPDLRAAEDLIFMSRVSAAGFEVAWAPGATVWWQMQPGLARTFRRFVLYSKHNVRAGRQWDWHYGVARQYAVAAVFVLLGIVHSPWWLAGLPLWLGARVFKSVWRRREGRGLLWALNPAQLAGVAVILLAIDAATFVGWAQAKLK